jgi:hypothetical protein
MGAALFTAVMLVMTSTAARDGSRPIRVEEAPSPWPSRAIFSSGIGAAIAGVVLASVSLERLNRAPSRVCLVRSADAEQTCAAGEEPDFVIGEAPPRDHGTVFVAAAGAGLIALGVAWIGGALTFDDDLWWVPAIGGLILGGGAFGALAIIGTRE